MLSGLQEIEYEEYEYPYQIHKVPVETNFFYHFIAIAAAGIQATGHVDSNNSQKQYPWEYVESVESGDEEE